MNAIISLCHFCENHGPNILYCTQAFHEQTSDGESIERSGQSFVNNDTSTTLFTKDEQTLNFEVPDTSESADNLEEVPELQGSKCTTSTQSSKVEIKCEACRSLPPSLSEYFSNDPEAQMRYVSSQHPSHTQIFSMVRQACLRSLSSEVSPGRDGPGPIFFGDDNSGYVLSHVFIIKDSQHSRGFQRLYSIIVVMMDKIYLLNSWPFLVKHITGIIQELQAKALTVYETEQAKSPTRSQRSVSRPGGELLSRNRNQMAPGKPARSLVELTGDKHIFRKLHQTFTWLLKAGGNRLTEKLLEGPPTEDSIIDLENHEETEEGFVLVESRKNSVLREDDKVEDLFDECSESSLGDDENLENCPVFRNLRHLLKVFGYSKFHKVSHHVAIGNQIIIRGHQRKLIRSAIDCLTVLLPRGCCRVVYYSRRHEASWRCNFLGLSPDAEIPDPVEPYVLVDVHGPDRGQGQADDDLEVQDAMMSLGLSDGEFSGYVFTVDSPCVLPEKGPVVLNKMEYVLLNDNLADSVVDQCIICLKEEWMNKVKVLFKFTRAGGRRSEEDTAGLLRVVGADEDRQLLKFWREGLSLQYKKHMLNSNLGDQAK